MKLYDETIPTRQVTADALETIEKQTQFHRNNPNITDLHCGYVLFNKSTGFTGKTIYKYYETAKSNCSEGVVSTTKWLLDNGKITKDDVPPHLLQRYHEAVKQVVQGDAKKDMFKRGMLLKKGGA